MKDISFRLLSKASGYTTETLKVIFPLVRDYPTAKVDIRGIVLSTDKKILLVKEGGDNKWSLPGGWADIGHSAKEVIIKEFKEETGLDIIPQKILAVFDKRMHPHPPEPDYVYKIIFYCKTISFEINKGFDILDVQYFDIDNLPTLSEHRILKSQIELLYKKIVVTDFETYFD